jgi:hypothetical protein
MLLQQLQLALLCSRLQLLQLLLWNLCPLTPHALPQVEQRTAQPRS